MEKRNGKEKGGWIEGKKEGIKGIKRNERKKKGTKKERKKEGYIVG